MTWGRLILLGLLALISPLGKAVPEKTASATEAEKRHTNLTAQIMDLRASHPPASECGACHSEQFKQWRASFHAQSLTTEGFFRTFPQYLEFLGNRAEEKPQAAMACFNCHAPVLRNAEPELVRQITALVLAKDTRKLDGFEVSCASCHTDGKREQPNVNRFHTSDFSASKEASSCATCHTWTPSSVPCSDVYTDWKRSKAKAQGKTCQSCHMAEQQGIAGAGGPNRLMHSHAFPGGRSPALLQQAVALGLRAGFRKNRLEVTTTVRNLTPHRVPDG
jgi:hypothetical protein